MGLRLDESQFEEYLSIYEEFPKEFAERDRIITQINNKAFGDPDATDGEKVMDFMFALNKKDESNVRENG